jgi:hypothetical protein
LLSLPIRRAAEPTPFARVAAVAGKRLSLWMREDAAARPLSEGKLSIMSPKFLRPPAGRALDNNDGMYPVCSRKGGGREPVARRMETDLEMHQVWCNVEVSLLMELW